MAVWLIAGVVSVILTVGMTFLFVIFSMIGLNGFTTASEALPTFLVFNCLAWPFMVGVTSLSSWVIAVIAKRPSSLKYLLLMNSLIVTIALGLTILTYILIA
jgi:hypothetical protein